MNFKPRIISHDPNGLSEADVQIKEGDFSHTLYGLITVHGNLI
jgi:hypothetical protein